VVSGDFNLIEGHGINSAIYDILANDDKNYILKLCNKNFQSVRTKSEVFSMKYCRKNTTIPVPHIYDFEPNAEESVIGKEYILMEKIEGVKLTPEIFNSFTLEQKINLGKSMAQILCTLQNIRFNKIGAFIDDDMNIGHDSLYYGGVGNNVNLELLDEEMDNTVAYMRMLMLYNAVNIENDGEERIREFGPWYRRFIENVIEKETNIESTIVLCHGDFGVHNFLIDPENGIINAVIDWEGAAARPAEYDLGGIQKNFFFT